MIISINQLKISINQRYTKMNKIIKISLLGLLSLSLMLGMSGGANAVTTIGVNSVTNDGVLTLTAADASTWATSSGLLTITGDDGLTLTATDTTNGHIIITTGHDFTVDGVAASIYAIGDATVAGTITIGGNAQTGNLNIGVSSATLNALNIGTGAGITNINIGTDNNVIDVIIIGSAKDDLDLAGEDIAITSADDIHIISTTTSGIINIGATTNVAHAINIGTVATSQTIKIGDNATPINVITIGGANSGLTVGGTLAITGATTASALVGIVFDDTTDGIVDALRLTHSSSDNNSTNSDGLGIQFYLETSANAVEEFAGLDVVATDLANGAEDTDFIFTQYIAGTMTETVRFDADAGVTLTSSAVASLPILHIKNTKDDATAPYLVLENDRATVADNDDCGTITFRASDEGGATFDAVTILGEAIDVTADQEAGKLTIDVEINDTATEMLCVYGDAGNVTTGHIYLNADEANVDFHISGDTTADFFHIDAGTEILTIGTASAYASDNYKEVATTCNLQANETADDGGIAINTWTTTATEGGGIFINTSDHATIGTHGALEDGDDIGGIYFNASDGSAFQCAAAITAEAGEACSAGDTPGDLVFWTSADASDTPVAQLTISDAGVATFTQPWVSTAGQTKSVIYTITDVELDGTVSPGVTSIGTTAQARFDTLGFDSDTGVTGDNWVFINWIVPAGYITDSADLHVYWTHSNAEDAADEITIDGTVNAIAAGEAIDAVGTGMAAVASVIADASASAGKMVKTSLDIEVEEIVIGDLVCIGFFVDESASLMAASGTADVHYFEITYESTE